MTRRRFFWQLYPAYLLVTVLALAAMTVYAIHSFEKFFWKQTTAELENTARLVGQMVAGLPSPYDRHAVDALCREVSRNVAKRITIILPSGIVLADSEEDPSAMENHADRAEVKVALAGSVGIATRPSRTLNREMMYVALPILKNGKPVAVVRTAMPMKALGGALHRFDVRIALDAAIVAFLVAAAFFIYSRRAMRPLEEIRRGAHHFRDGDLSWRLRVQGPAEIRSLAETMNQMAAELAARMERLKELEDIRREFVANVSHELKTPVTSIRGFAETLRDDSEADPRLAKQYLEIIAAQAGRLSSIIEDLLQLSRIEQETHGGGTIEHSCSEIRPLIESAVAILSTTAREKKIGLAIVCTEGLTADINAPLLEQAIVNLIDNAIKYSGEGRPVRVEARPDGNSVRIDVCDEGLGIAAEHLPRIFERFYRVDKGRSRKLGGTGLGLAIVKHIVHLHGGSVSVKSEMGKGSTFTILIPIIENPGTKQG